MIWMKIPPLRPAGHHGRDDVQEDGESPQPVECVASHDRSGHDRDQPADGHERERANHGALGSVGGPRDPNVQSEPDETDEHVGQREPYGIAAERTRYRDGHEERDACGQQRTELDRGVGRISRVERPSELGPAPPDEPEHEHRLAQSRPIQLVM